MSITIERITRASSPAKLKPGNERSLRQVTGILRGVSDFKPGVFDRRAPGARQGELPQSFSLPPGSMMILIDPPWSSRTDSTRLSFYGLLASRLSGLNFKVKDDVCLKDTTGSNFLVCAVIASLRNRYMKPV